MKCFPDAAGRFDLKFAKQDRIEDLRRDGAGKSEIGPTLKPAYP
jgi:hypothetical protein